MKRAAAVFVVWTSFDGSVAARDASFEDVTEDPIH